MCCSAALLSSLSFFSFTAPATSGIYTLSLHDALPIWGGGRPSACCSSTRNRRSSSTCRGGRKPGSSPRTDRKSIRLNSSHRCISYAVFCLKKKTKKITQHKPTHKENEQKITEKRTSWK